jgi:hypothetical protein
MSSPIDVVRACLRADVPVLVWGPPGTGKTATILALARQGDAHLETLIGSTLDPIDVGGYLVPPARGRDVISVPPPWARRIRESLDRRQPTWLFLDELSCSPPAVQAALLRVVHERRVGEVDIRGCRVVAAANPADSAADGGSLSPAAANRFAHVDWSVDVSAWCAGTMRGWDEGHPSPRAAAIAASVAAFVQAHPASLCSMPESEDARGRAWPSPRAWSALVRACAEAPDEAIGAIARALVGPAADEWVTYHVSRDLPDPEDVLEGRASLPTRGDRAAATLAAVVAAATARRPDRDARITRAWDVLVSARADVAVPAARALLDASDRIPRAAAEYAERLRAGGAR